MTIVYMKVLKVSDKNWQGDLNLEARLSGLPLTKEQRRLGLCVVVGCRRAADDHRRACIASETLLQDARQLAVTVRNEALQHHPHIITC